jgi:hypothetical protein
VTSELWEVIFVNDNEGWIVGGGIGHPGVILHTTNGGVITDVNENNIPGEFSLSQNYPNPFNPSTNIKFTISDFGFVSLKVYDVLGNEVATLVNEEKPAGEYEIEFNSHSGLSGIKELSSGIYFYQLKTEGYIETKKMLLLK